MGLVKPNAKAGVLIAIAACFAFSLYPPSARAAYADGANAAFVLLLTTLIRTAVLVGFCLKTGRRCFQTKIDTLSAIKGGIAQAVSILGIVVGLAYMQGPLVVIIVFTHTLMLLLYMAWRGEVKLDGPTLLTTVGALVGLVFALDLFGRESTVSLIGFSLVFMSAIATVCRLYVYGHETQSRDPAVIGAENFLVATGLMFLVLLWQVPAPPMHVSGWLWTIVSGLAFGGGTFGMFYAVAHLGAFRWSLLSKIEPVLTAILSAVLVGEYLRVSQYAGIGLVLVSLVGYHIWDYRIKRCFAPSCKTEKTA